MDPLVVFDCYQQLPNRFALARAAAARSRALNAGVVPRVEATGSRGTDLALREIAAGVFGRQELEPFLPGRPVPLMLAETNELRGGEPLHKDAAAPGSRARDTVH
jgi:DNA-directed RNA polymerase subunit omega